MLPLKKTRRVVYKLLCFIMIVIFAVSASVSLSFAASSIMLTGENYPGTIVRGTTFSVYGTVTSKNKLTYVKVGVKDAGGKYVFSAERYPQAAEFDIHSVDSQMTFSKLSTGNYTYVILAGDASSGSETLLSKSFSVKESGFSNLRISGENYPEKLTKGSTFSVYGTVSSDEKITGITAGVYDSGGKAVFEYTGAPYTYSFDVHSIDASMKFSSLPSGNYTYKITASDTVTKNKVLLSKSFSVKESGISDLKITDADYPEYLTKGSTFSVHGTVTSDEKITSVTAGVYDAGGKAAFEYTGAPYTYSFDVHSIDASMKFSSLPAGNYTYKITASDTVTKNKVLLSKSFTVRDSEVSGIKLSGENYPTNLTKGSSFSVYGTVTSVEKLTNITAGVYDSNGNAAFEYKGTPNAYSFDIHSIDAYMRFSTLSCGTYSYKIYASDAVNGRVLLMNRTFTVMDTDFPEKNMKSVNMDVLDLSKYNVIDSWSRLAADVDGVILRVGGRGMEIRTIYKDTCFVDFYQNAKAAGLHIGCYFFSNALNESEAVEEADYVLSVLKSNNCKMDMPVYMDIETPAQYALSSSRMTEVARAFCDRIKEKGYCPGIYTSTSFAHDEMYPSQLSDICFWIAQYNSRNTYTGPYGMWQYSERGVKPYMTGYVDLNYCYYDYPSYILSHNLNGLRGSGTADSTPGFEIRTGNGVKVNQGSSIIYGIPAKMKPSQFENKYISLSGASVEFSGTVGGFIATGTVLKFKKTGNPVKEYTLAVNGDVDGNAELNSSDALLVLQSSVGSKVLYNEKKLSADYNGDGVINSSDALGILKESVSG